MNSPLRLYLGPGRETASGTTPMKSRLPAVLVAVSLAVVALGLAGPVSAANPHLTVQPNRTYASAVAKVSTTQRQLTLRRWLVVRHTFTVPLGTPIVATNGRALKLGDLRVGDKVLVWWTLDNGQQVIHRITHRSITTPP